MTHEPLVQRALRGDVTAFEALYRAHVAMVHTLARRMLGDSQADDLTQDTFVRAWQRLSTFRGEGSFAGWLRRLATNVCATQARRGQREHVVGPQVDELHAVPDPPAGARLDLEAAIERLPPRARAVFVLYDVEGHTHEEVARLLGIDSGTSKSQLHRARHLLRMALGPRDAQRGAS